MISPLAGIKILDFTRVLAGPFCTMLLGDLGATVIKIERPVTGDDTRSWKPPQINGQSCYFICANRNKQSVVIDLQKPKGSSIAKRLAQECDVVVENFIPGTMDRLGLGYKILKEINPALIYCSISGYGTDGPYARRGGYDVIAAGIGGYLHITGPEDGEPCKPGTAMTDIGTGMYAHGAIMAALVQRHKTGLGQKIDCNLLSTQVSTLVNIGSSYLNCGIEGRKLGTAHASVTPYQGFRTADGHIIIGAGNDGQFKELCQFLNRSDLAMDEKYKSNALRVVNQKELIDQLKAIFITKTNAEWLTVFKDAQFAYGPVNTVQQVFEDPQVLHNKMVHTVKDSNGGEIKLLAPAVKYSESENSIRLPPPLLGEHTKEILENVLKLSTDEIQRLSDEKIVQLL